MTDVTLEPHLRNSQLIVDSSAGARTVVIPAGLSAALAVGAVFKISAPFASTNPVSFVFGDPTEQVNLKSPAAIAPLTSDDEGFLLVKNGTGAWSTCFRSTGVAGQGGGALFQSELAVSQAIPLAGSAAILYPTPSGVPAEYTYTASTGVLVFNVAGQYQLGAGTIITSGVFSDTRAEFMVSSGGPAVPFAPQSESLVTLLAATELVNSTVFSAAAGDSVFLNVVDAAGGPVTAIPRSGFYAVKVG